MWFRNLQLYRLPRKYALTAAQLAEYLAKFAFGETQAADMVNIGFVPPREGGALVHQVGSNYLIAMKQEKKLLPSSVVNAVAKAKAAELEEQQGFPPGRKAMKELKERVAEELLPRAFSVPSMLFAWIDTENGWLVIDAASPTRADDMVKMLLKAIDMFPLQSLRVQRSPVAVMTAWLEMDEAPHGFTVDKDAELRATGESKPAIRYVKHTLERGQIRQHISAGKQATRLAMTWADKISFVLTESLAVKAIKPLDVLKEGDSVTRDDAERFDNDMTLMCGEMAGLLADLVEALGGFADEQADLVDQQNQSA